MNLFGEFVWKFGTWVTKPPANFNNYFFLFLSLFIQKDIIRSIHQILWQVQIHRKNVFLCGTCFQTILKIHSTKILDNRTPAFAICHLWGSEYRIGNSFMKFFNSHYESYSCIWEETLFLDWVGGHITILLK